MVCGSGALASSPPPPPFVLRVLAACDGGGGGIVVPRADTPPGKRGSGVGAGRGVCVGGGRLWVGIAPPQPRSLEVNWEAFTLTVGQIFRFTVCFVS